MTKKTESTFKRFIESLNPEERKQFDEEYRELLLSELILAIKEKDSTSIEKLSSNIMSNNKHIGSDFDDFLKDKDILEEVELAAIKTVMSQAKSH